MKEYILSLILLLILSFSLPTVTGSDWVQYQKDSKNTGGYMQNTNADSWIYRNTGSVVSAAIRVDDSIYFINGSGTVISLNIPERNIKWYFSDNNSRSEMKSPVLRDSSLFFLSKSGTLYSLNTTGGDILWKLDTPGNASSSPAANDRSVYFGSSKSLYSVNIQNGDIRWVEKFKGYAVSPITLYKDSVYLITIQFGRNSSSGIKESKLYAFSTNGSLRWKITKQNVITVPVITKQRAFFGVQNGTVYAVDKKSGAVQWSISLGTRSVSFPSFSNGKLYMGTYSGTLYSINSTTGEVVWKFRGRETRRMLSTPAVVRGRVYMPTRSGDLYVVNSSTGRLIWNVSVNSFVFASPTVVNRTIYLPTSDGLYALNNRTVGELGVGSANKRNFNQKNSTQGENQTGGTSESSKASSDRNSEIRMMVPFLLGLILLILVLGYHFYKSEKR